MDKNRHSIRLSGYDYYQSGWYFVTICTQNRENMFGEIVGVGRDRPVCDASTYMKLNPMGKIIKNVWKSLPDHHPVKLDAFQIMPNHVHFIIQIGSHSVVTGASRRAPTLGFIIGLFKSECTKQIHTVGATRGSPSGHGDRPPIIVFQRNYYEHIIRNESEYLKIKEYIQRNPMMWERDRNNPKNILLQ